jgi:hypothetical protein
MEDLNNLPIGTEVVYIIKYPWTEFTGKVTAQGRSMIINGETVTELIIDDTYSTFNSGVIGGGCCVVRVVNHD